MITCKYLRHPCNRCPTASGSLATNGCGYAAIDAAGAVSIFVSR